MARRGGSGNNDGIQIRLKGLRIVKFNRAALDAPGFGVVWLAQKAAAQAGVKYAREELAKGGHNDTGALSRSIVGTVRTTALGPQAVIGSPLPQALWVNSGTANEGSGRIYPRSAKVLRFNEGKRSGNGAMIFAPSVQGQKPTRFLEKAMAKLRLFY